MAKEEGRIEGAKIGRGGLSVTHLFFANNSILFGKASKAGISAVKEVVNEYKQISGQLVNFDKLLIYFSDNMNDGVKSLLREILGVRIVNNPKKYLGLPTMIG